MRDDTTAFARRIVSGELIAGELEIAACRRHLEDIETGHERGLSWHADRAQQMIEAYPAYFSISDGPRAGEPFKLLDWMMFVTGSLFGWYKTDLEGNERWRFDEAYVETAKGQGKSPWMAATGLIAIGGLGRKRAQAIVTGPKDDQALITLGDAAAMVRATMPGEEDGVSLESEGKYKVRGLGANAHTVEHIASGGVFRTMSGKATQISGPRPDVVFVDEVHELATVALIDMHQAALAKNARGGLLIACSNTPAQTQGVGTYYSERAQRVVKGLDRNDSLFVYITRVDVADRETVFDNEPVWRKSMPALGITFPRDNIRREVAKARVNPSEANRVKRLYFGIPTGAVDFWLDDPTLWDNAQAVVDEKALVNVPCWLALDLSDKHDLTALSAGWLLPAEGQRPEQLVTKTWYWTCSANLDKRAREDQMPYPLWQEQGFLNVVEGNSITKDYIALEVARLVDEHDVRFMAYDPAKMASFIEACERVGLPVWRFNGKDEKPGQGLMLVGHGQGLRIAFAEKQLSMPTSIEALEDRLREGTIIIDANPITTACASNAAPISDATGNRAFDKARSRGRIDGLVTLAMVAGAAAMKTPERKKAGVILL